MSLKAPPSGVFYSTASAATFASGNTDIRNTPISLSNYSKTTCSFWFNGTQLNREHGLIYQLGGGTNAGVTFSLDPVPSVSIHKINLTFGAVSNNTFQYFYSDASINSYFEGMWHNIIVQWDYSQATARIYIDGAPISLSNTTGSAVSSATPINDFYIGRNNASRCNLSLSEFWLQSNLYLDLSTLAARRKFIYATRRPVFLGATGNVITGSQAEVYLKGTGTGFITNSGSIGNFAASTGTLTTPSTTPST